MRGEARRWQLLATAGAVAVLPFVLMAAARLPFMPPGQYALHLAVVIGINTIVALGLNLLMGYAGQVSLGQAAFVAVGAYGTGILTTKTGLSPWAAMAAGVGLSAGMAGVVGVPLLKLRGHYLAMGTLGFGIIVKIAIAKWDSLTEGTIGIMGIPALSIGGFEFDTALRMYYLVAGAAVVCLALASNIVDSRVGRAMRAVHGSEVAAGTSGVDTARYKLQVFILSGAMAGLAGSLYAHHAGYLHPDSFGFHYSIELVVMVVLGGMASIWGAIFGAAAVTLIAEQLRHFQEFSTIIFGLVLVVIMVFMPSGLGRGMGDLVRRLGPLRRGRSSETV